MYTSYNHKESHLRLPAFDFRKLYNCLNPLGQVDLCSCVKFCGIDFRPVFHKAVGQKILDTIDKLSNIKQGANQCV